MVTGQHKGIKFVKWTGNGHIFQKLLLLDKLLSCLSVCIYKNRILQNFENGTIFAIVAVAVVACNDNT